MAHFAYTWRVETYASRTNAETWKNRPLDGGGVLGNFVSHVFYNIEWLLGRIDGFDGMVCPQGRRSGRAVRRRGAIGERGRRKPFGQCTDAFLGSGHLLEVYGDKGTLVLQQSHVPITPQDSASTWGRAPPAAWPAYSNTKAAALRSMAA